MRLGNRNNGTSCEIEMQQKFKNWLNDRKLLFSDEFRVPRIGRIADFLIIKGNRLINVEAKSNDFVCLIRQMNDHANYADYSFAFIPDYSITPKHFKKALLENGYGLIIYNYETGTITEVLEAHYNHPQMNGWRKSIMKKIQEIQEELL